MGEKCCFTGYRPEKLTFLKDEYCDDYRNLYTALECLIKGAVDKGYTYFISGFAEGVDLMAAEIVLNLKREGFPLFLEAAMPAPDQSRYWSERSQCIHELLLSSVDRIICADKEMNRYSALKRNRYMVEQSDLVIAVFNGITGGTSYTVNYAREKHRSLWILNPEDCTITREEGLFENI